MMYRGGGIGGGWASFFSLVVFCLVLSPPAVLCASRLTSPLPLSFMLLVHCSPSHYAVSPPRTHPSRVTGEAMPARVAGSGLTVVSKLLA
jgi:hypothetical protein